MWQSLARVNHVLTQSLMGINCEPFKITVGEHSSSLFRCHLYAKQVCSISRSPVGMQPSKAEDSMCFPGRFAILCLCENKLDRTLENLISAKLLDKNRNREARVKRNDWLIDSSTPSRNHTT